MSCYRVLVCGTRFGEVYARALLEEPERYQLIGLLARGSEHSLRLADELSVPLYRDLEDLPPRIDIACIALRSKAFGGSGSEVASALLQRGIHVLQEHPVAAADIRTCRQRAGTAGVRYHVNSFYSHGSAVGAFLDFIRRWRTTRCPHYAMATTSSQFLFSSLDIMGRALGSLEPFVIGEPGAWPPQATAGAVHGIAPFRALQGTLGGMPFLLQLQSYIDPRDPDHHALVQHRLAVGAPEGFVELCSSFGPVIWSGPFYLSGYADHASAPGSMAERLAAADRPTCAVLADSDGATMATIIHDVFPPMVLTALDELTLGIEGGDEAAPFQSEAYLLDLASAWQAAMRRIHPLTNVELAPPPLPQPAPHSFRNALAHGRS